jgi:hypothetical protein
MISDAEVGAVTTLLNIPLSLSLVNDWATIIIRKIDAKAKSPETKVSKTVCEETSTMDGLVSPDGLRGREALFDGSQVNLEA